MDIERFSVYFFIKTDRRTAGGHGFVYCRVRSGGEVQEFSTKQRWFTERWDRSQMRPNDKREDARALSSYLDSLYARIVTIKNERTFSYKSILPKDIVDELLGEPPDRVGLTDLLIAHIRILKKLAAAGEIAQATWKKFLYLIAHLKVFFTSFFQISDIPICKVDNDFIVSFYGFLRKEKAIGEATAKKYLSNIRTIVIKAHGIFHRGM